MPTSEKFHIESIRYKLCICLGTIYKARDCLNDCLNISCLYSIRLHQHTLITVLLRGVLLIFQKQVKFRACATESFGKFSSAILETISTTFTKKLPSSKLEIT